MNFNSHFFSVTMDNRLPGFAADLAKHGLLTPLCSDMADCEHAEACPSISARIQVERTKFYKLFSGKE